MVFEKIRELIENLDLSKTVSELLITTANIVIIAKATYNTIIYC